MPHLAGCAALAVAAASTSLACTVATDVTAPEELAEITHALIQVRSVHPAAGPERANALAGFVRVPLSADPGEILTRAGIRPSLPPEGNCETLAAATTPELNESGDPAFPEGSFELLPVDALSLTTSGGEHPLAPRAFPSVSGWLSGVVYTSRDQDAGSLPAAGSFHIRARGVDGRFDVETSHQSPPTVTSVTVGGLPFFELDTLPASSPVDVTWAPSGDPLDLIALALSTGELTHVCTFADRTGAGSLALGDLGAAAGLGGFAPGSAASLSVHRVRSEASASKDAGFVVEVRFDFSLLTDVTLK